VAVITARDVRRVTNRFTHVWEGVTWHALAVNIGLRLFIVIFTIDALINAGDERFAGKALGPRNVGILLGLSLLFPLLQAVRGQWKRYPMWYDNLYLSVFWLDMAGNSLNLYNAWEHWDHIPHFHGPGALAAVLMGAFGLRPLAAAGLSTMLHVALEVQEYYGDVILHTHNVSGIQDSMNDILFGLLGVIVYTIVFANSHYLERRKAPKKRARSR
jgi:hypothetical protein